MFIKEEPSSDNFEKQINGFKRQIRDKSLRYLNHQFKLQLPERDDFIRLDGISWALAITLLYKNHSVVEWNSIDLHNHAKSVNRALFNAIHDSIQSGYQTEQDWLLNSTAYTAYDFLGNAGINFNLVKKTLLLDVIKKIPSFSSQLADEVDYLFWLSFGTWHYIATACLMVEFNPKNLRYDIFIGQREYHIPVEKKQLFNRYLEIFESWGVEHMTPLEWIERCLKSTLHIPQKLWDEFKLQYMEKCRYEHHLQVLYPAIQYKTKNNDNEMPPSQPQTPPPSQTENLDDTEAELAYLKNPRDRNARLLKDAATLYLNDKNQMLAQIHKKIIEQERGKSDVTIHTLKYAVSLEKVKAHAKKLESEVVT